MPRHSPYALFCLNFLVYISLCKLRFSLANNFFGCFSFSIFFAFLAKNVVSLPTFSERPFSLVLLSLLSQLLTLVNNRSFLNYLFRFRSLFGFQWTIFAHLKGTLWWAQVDSNHRPLGYQPSALASWAISPYAKLGISEFWFSVLSVWVSEKHYAYNKHLSVSCLLTSIAT